MTIIAVFYVGSIVAVFQVSGTDNLKGLLDWRSFPYLLFADFSHLHWQERRRHFLSPFLQLKFSWWPNAPNFDRENNSSFFFCTFCMLSCPAAKLSFSQAATAARPYQKCSCRVCEREREKLHSCTRPSAFAFSDFFFFSCLGRIVPIEKSLKTNWCSSNNANGRFHVRVFRVGVKKGFDFLICSLFRMIQGCQCV